MSFLDGLPVHGGGMLMCIFEARDENGMTRRALPLPLPKEIEEVGGTFVLDYEGSFTASYNWVPAADHFDPKFEEWHDMGGDA